MPENIETALNSSGSTRANLLSTVDRLDTFLSRASWVGNVLAACTLAIMCLMTTVSVLARNVFDVALFDAVTPTKLMMVLVSFLGCAWAMRQGEHVSADFVFERLPPRWARLIRGVALLGALAALVLVIYETGKFAYEAYVLDRQIIGGVSVPAYLFQAVIPLCLGFLALETLRKAIQDIAAAIAGNTLVHESPQVGQELIVRD